MKMIFRIALFMFALSSCAVFNESDNGGGNSIDNETNFTKTVEIVSEKLQGFRDVQLHSNKIVTAWLGYESTNNVTVLSNPENYTIFSDNDPDFKDGVKPVEVYRSSNLSYLDKSSWIPDMDHKMHCVVNPSFKPGKSYKILLSDKLLPNGFSLEKEFSLDSTPNPSFKLNQVGYSNLTNKKFIYLSSYIGDGNSVDLSTLKTFSIINEDNNSEVFTGYIELVSKNDLQGKDVLYKLDISSFKDEGNFHAYIDGFGRSYSFLNGAEATKKIYELISLGMYCQRSGAEIEEGIAGDWARPMAHNKIYVTKKNISNPWTENIYTYVPTPHIDPKSDSTQWYDPDGPYEFHGGHYDAADFDIRLSHVGVAERLLSLYESSPEKFDNSQSNTPYILDEASWSLMAWEYLQDYATEIRGLDGGIPSGVESYAHPVLDHMGHNDIYPYWMKKVTPYSSFAGAAVFAQASRVFRDIDSDKADEYLVRARRAYKYAIDHIDEKWEPLTLFTEDTEVKSVQADSAYTDNELKCMQAWAAGQLFTTTGENKFLTDFEEVKSIVLSMGDPISLTIDKWIILWPMISTSQTNNNGVKSELERLLLAASDISLSKVDHNGNNGYYSACSNTGWFGEASPLNTRNINAVIRSYMLTKEQKYLDVISTSLDFVLGMNPSERSWITGAGIVYPMNPLNVNCMNDGVAEPYPGIVIMGPTLSEYSGEMGDFIYPAPKDMGLYRKFVDADAYCVEQCEYTVHEDQISLYIAAGLLLE